MYHSVTAGSIFVFELPVTLFRIGGQLAAILLLFLSSAVEASHSSPELKLFLRAEYTYDSNMFRLTDPDEAAALLGSSQLSDKVLQTGGGLNFRMPVSQQELAMGVETVYNKYDRFDFLDHASGSASASWAWSYGGRWDGNVRAAFVRDMPGFEESRITEKDILDQWRFLVSGTYALSTRWELYLAATRNVQLHDLASRQTLDRNVDRGVVEIRYKTPRKSYLGFKTVVRSAELPNQELVESTLVDNSYLEYINSLTVDWAISAHSGFSGSVGYTKREYDSFSLRDYSGLTWQSDYRWRPQSRYELNVSMWRDLDVYSDRVSSYVTETGGSLQGMWAITPKVSITADFSRKSRSYDGDPRFSQVRLPSRHDWLVSYGISAAYSLSERLRIDLEYLFEERQSNMDEWEYDYCKLIFGIAAIF